MNRRHAMESNNWQNLQRTWKQEKKPDIDVESLRKEVKKRGSLKKLRIVVETMIVLAVVVYTVNRLTTRPDFLGMLILAQLWFITILALAFNIWNRLSLNAAGNYSHKSYLKLLVNHSLKRKRTAIFVFVLTLLNLSIYVALFFTGYISLTTGAVLRIAGLLLVYTVWSAWYYRMASSDITYFEDELKKSMMP